MPSGGAPTHVRRPHAFQLVVPRGLYSGEVWTHMHVPVVKPDELWCRAREARVLHVRLDAEMVEVCAVVLQSSGKQGRGRSSDQAKP